MAQSTRIPTTRTAMARMATRSTVATNDVGYLIKKGVSWARAKAPKSPFAFCPKRNHH